MPVRREPAGDTSEQVWRQMHKSMMKKMRRMPMFPLMPLVPVTAMITVVSLSVLNYRGVRRLEHKLEHMGPAES